MITSSGNNRVRFVPGVKQHITLVGEDRLQQRANRGWDAPDLLPADGQQIAALSSYSGQIPILTP